MFKDFTFTNVMKYAIMMEYKDMWKFMLRNHFIFVGGGGLSKSPVAIKNLPLLKMSLFCEADF